MTTDIIKMFKALSDRNRLRAFSLLLKAETPLCVCEIVDVLGVSQYNVSRYVKDLKQAGLLEEKREGKWVYYSIKNRSGIIISSTEKIISNLPDTGYLDDMRRLELRLSLREEGRCTVGLKREEWLKLKGFPKPE
jgi:ArsR family transcriptional regulator